jgi:hypothetical protein
MIETWQQVKLEAAEKEVKRAESVLAEAQRALQAFVNENFQALPTRLIYVTTHDRDQLDDDLKALVAKVDAAKDKFHKALATWAALKP